MKTKPVKSSSSAQQSGGELTEVSERVSDRRMGSEVSPARSGVLLIVTTPPTCYLTPHHNNNPSLSQACPVTLPSPPVQLSSKRLQCIRSLVNLAQCYADYLEGGWSILLQTLHHLAGILGLEPQPNGSLRPVRRSDTTNVVGHCGEGGGGGSRMHVCTFLIPARPYRPALVRSQPSTCCVISSQTSLRAHSES